MGDTLRCLWRCTRTDATSLKEAQVRCKGKLLAKIVQQASSSLPFRPSAVPAMAEALAALGVAATVVRFVDCGMRWTASAKEIYDSDNGTLAGNNELEMVADSIRDMAYKMKTDDRLQKDHQLNALLIACDSLAHQLKNILAGLRVEVKRVEKIDEQMIVGQNVNRVGSVIKAFKSMLSKDDIQGMQRRLERIRDQFCAQANYLLASQQAAIIPSLCELVDSTKSSVNTIDDELRKMNSQLQNITAVATSKVHGWDQAALNSIASHMHTLYQYAVKVRQILKSLHFSQLRQRQSEIQEAHKHTFEWIFKSDTDVNLATWLQSDDSFYWISGKPGSGKSTLMKFLYDNIRTHQLLQKWAGDCQVLTAAHFFWSAGTPLQKSQEGLLRTLLSQILNKAPDIAPIVCTERWANDSSTWFDGWTHAELCSVFQRFSLLPNLRTRFCFFVDGLDEYDGDHHELAKSLSDISRSPNIKICASSRPWNEFTDAFGHSQWKLSVHQLTVDDIRSYVQHNLEANHLFLKLRAREPTSAASFTEDICEKSHGVFLWVYLVVRYLLRGLTDRDVVDDLRRRLEELPDDLEKYFDLMMTRIESVYMMSSARIFQLLVAAEGTMPLIALHFLDMERDDPNYYRHLTPCGRVELEPILEDKRWHLNAQCKDLLQVTTRSILTTSDKSLFSNDEVSFLHRTVLEFLRDKHMETLLKTRSGLDFNPILSMCKISLAQIKFRPIDCPLDEEIIPSLVHSTIYYAQELELRFERSDATVLQDLFTTISVNQNVSHYEWEALLRRNWIDLDCKYCCFMCLAIPCGLSLCVSRNFEQFSGGELHQARLLRISLSPKHFMDSSVEGFDYSRVKSTTQFLLDRKVSPNLPLRKERSVWAEYLAWLEDLPKLSPSPARNFCFETCQLMISHGADRWMRCQSEIEPSKSLESNPFTLALDKDAFTILRHHFNESECALLESCYTKPGPGGSSGESTDQGQPMDQGERTDQGEHDKTAKLGQYRIFSQVRMQTQKRKDFMQHQGKQPGQTQEQERSNPTEKTQSPITRQRWSWFSLGKQKHKKKQEG